MACAVRRFVRLAGKQKFGANLKPLFWSIA